MEKVIKAARDYAQQHGGLCNLFETCESGCNLYDMAGDSCKFKGYIDAFLSGYNFKQNEKES